jgi:hypothetical protein
VNARRRENLTFVYFLWVPIRLWIPVAMDCLIDCSHNVQVASREYFNAYRLLYGHIVVALDPSK